MRGFDHEMILSPMQFPRSLQGTPGTMSSHLCTKYDEKRVADYESRCLRKRD